jgi:GT2 family glycosyltransferase
MTDKFFRCSLFDTKINDLTEFSFLQEELLFSRFLENKKASYQKIDVEYKVKTQLNNLDPKKIPLILPIRGMEDLLAFTLSNLVENGAFEVCNIIVVDDRTPTPLSAVLDSFEDLDISYIRIDNEKGFNYSNLANIAAYTMSNMGFDEIIFWNSDMWLADTTTLPELIRLHKSNNCTLSGTKLAYPVTDWESGEKISENHKVQFGGSVFVFQPATGRLLPIHFKRGADIDHFAVNVDTFSFFNTGAYCMMDLNWFIENGGFNPSLSKVFNDVDMSLRVAEQNKVIMYFGKDKFLIHGESLNLENGTEPKYDQQFTSDSVLFNSIWDFNRIARVIYGA